MRLLLTIAAWTCLAAAADAQPAEPARQTLQEALARADALAPERRLGVRASLLRQTQQVIPVVVIAEDEASYAEAIASWRGVQRFPVLLDDFTPECREDIARFVRGFQPERVVRYHSGGAPWPGVPDAREERMRGAVNRALGLSADAGSDDQVDAIRRSGAVFTGMVVADPASSTWTGAVALAAGRLQPLVFVGAPETVRFGAYVESAGEGLARSVERAAARTGLRWGELGDDIDAVTMAFDGPIRIARGDKSNDFLALTDRVGRLGDNGNGARWAWASQLFGSPAQCAYQAMCALFLEIDSAWIFDGYPTEPPWDNWDGTRAGDTLERVGFRDVTVIDDPLGGLRTWRQAASRGIAADMLLINTKGMRDTFQLAPGQGYAGDMPLLEHPALVHMVHSFSLATPWHRWTIGGRLLVNGAYGYVGSVHEPGLGAFVPTPVFAARMASGFPVGAAARISGEPWRIAVLGDALLTLGPAGRRVEAELPLADVEDIEEEARAAVRDRNFGRAVTLLAMSGRDSDAARLASAVLDDAPEAFDEPLAAAAMPVLLRAGRHEEAARAFRMLSAQDKLYGFYRDVLWHAGRSVIGDVAIEALLRDHPREPQEVRDAIEVAEAMAARTSGTEAAAYLERVLDDTEGKREQRALRDAITRLATGGRP